MDSGTLTIAIDFDDTFTADTALWRSFIAMAVSLGHSVICVSSRRDDFGNRRQLVEALPDGIPVLLCYDCPKREFAESKGYVVDIWIDDVPEAIEQGR